MTTLGKTKKLRDESKSASKFIKIYWRCSTFVVDESLNFLSKRPNGNKRVRHVKAVVPGVIALAPLLYPLLLICILFSTGAPFRCVASITGNPFVHIAFPVHALSPDLARRTVNRAVISRVGIRANMSLKIRFVFCLGPTLPDP